MTEQLDTKSYHISIGRCVDETGLTGRKPQRYRWDSAIPSPKRSHYFRESVQSSKFETPPLAINPDNVSTPKIPHQNDLVRKTRSGIIVRSQV